MPKMAELEHSLNQAIWRHNFTRFNPQLNTFVYWARSIFSVLYMLFTSIWLARWSCARIASEDYRDRSVKFGVKWAMLQFSCSSLIIFYLRPHNRGDQRFFKIVMNWPVIILPWRSFLRVEVSVNPMDNGTTCYYLFTNYKPIIGQRVIWLTASDWSNLPAFQAFHWRIQSCDYSPHDLNLRNFPKDYGTAVKWAIGPVYGSIVKLSYKLKNC